MLGVGLVIVVRDAGKLSPIESDYLHLPRGQSFLAVLRY